MAIPAVAPLGLPLPVSQPTRDFYNAIENLPEGSIVVIHASISVGLLPEQGPLFRAIIEHVSRRNLKWVLISVTAETQSITDDILKTTDLHGDTYGEDYANMGIVMNTEPAIAAWAKDIWANTPVDTDGTPIAQIPLMKNLKTLSDFDLCIINVGSLIEFWMRQWIIPYKVPSAVACNISTAVVGWRVYYDAGQFIGLVPAIRGAGEYEVILRAPGKASITNDQMSLAHIMTVLAIIGANIVYFTRRKE
jgi:hypothetical protein